MAGDSPPFFYEKESSASSAPWFRCLRLQQIRRSDRLGVAYYLSKDLLDLLAAKQFVYEVFQFRAESIMWGDHRPPVAGY